MGPQGWWPGQSPLEVMVGAILVQNTSWKNVERAIDNLRHAKLLDARRLLDATASVLEQHLHPAGYFRVKARRLQSLMQYFVSRYDGSIEQMQKTSTEVLRNELLAVHGVGPETADSILCYALDRAVLVVDAYTRRIWARHGWIATDCSYQTLQGTLRDGLPVSQPLYNELHALVVAVGNRYCRRTPRCDECPLREMLPKGGVIEGA
mgnify:CR=1 FL=1